MKAALVSTVALAVAGASPCRQPSAAGCVELSRDEDWDKVWAHYQTHHKKTYGSAEESERRREVWQQNVAYILDENEKNHTYSLGLTPHTDLTHEEYVATRLGYKPENDTAVFQSTYLGNFRFDGDVATLPSDWDWSSASIEVVTPVKDQGSCGSCWSFSATGILEGAVAVGDGWTVPMSEQQLMDCDSDSSGCDGGNHCGALDWEKKQNVCSEASYPYKGKDGSCQSSGCDAVLTLGSIWGKYSVDEDEGSHCAAVIQRPLGVSIDASSDDFSHYKSGIFSGSCTTSTDHAILLVGYGYADGYPYWKVKNSWGTDWGYDGYLILQRVSGSGPGTCGIQTHTCSAVVYGPYNPSSQIRGEDGEFIADVAKSRATNRLDGAVVV